MILALILGIAGLPSDVSAFSLTITVFTAADNTTQDGLCSLREAITNANNNARTFTDCSTGLGSEIIAFASGLASATILLSSPLPPISDVSGLTIIGGGKITVSGGGLYQVFALNANVPLTLNGMTVANGHNEPNGGGVFVGSGAQLTILDSTFNHNSATFPAAGGLGGGVDNHGTLTISNSTFSNNSADGAGGEYVTYLGLATCEAVAGQWFWLQTYGPRWITSNSNTCDSAMDRTIVFVGNGSVVSSNDVVVENGFQIAGYALDTSGSSASNAPMVFLTLMR